MRVRPSLWRVAPLALAALLAGCASAPPADTPAQALADSAWARASTQAIDQGPWQPWAMPGKTPGRYAPQTLDGHAALGVEVESAVVTLRKRVRVEPAQLGELSFSWMVPWLIANADMASRELDDAPVRVVLAFEGDRTRLSPRAQMFSELVRSLTGEELPYATMMYVWCRQRPVGTVIPNPRTDRIRKLVVDSGPEQLGHWREHRRPLAEDFQRVFGEPPGALVAVGIMSDTDNTRSHARAWYGPIRWVAP